jgi:ATP-dependent Lhr-like helicase
MESGDVRVVACDLTQPSPLALEVLSARPYAFLDDAPLEERRAQAVMARRWQDPQTASDLGRLDPEAILRVKSEAWPEPIDAEELHDALLWIGCLTEPEIAAAPEWAGWLEALARDKRATRLDTGETAVWVAAERLTQFAAVWPKARLAPKIAAPDGETVWSSETALIEILRGRLEGLGPVTQTALSTALGLEPESVATALAALEAEGTVMRGRFLPGANDAQWCDRRLLARIHHYTIKRLRAEIEPVAARDFLRFLLDWQHVDEEARLEGPEALSLALDGLEGFEAPAGAWETEILPARLSDYEPSYLDRLCLSGRIAWARLIPPAPKGRAATPIRSSPVALLERRRLGDWMSVAAPAEPPQPSPRALAALEALQAQGALFFDELSEASRLLRTELETALGELAALGLVTSDSFGGLRALLVPSEKRKPIDGAARRKGRVLSYGMESAGRWSPIRRLSAEPGSQARTAAVEHVAQALLRRYGVVFWRLLAREASALPPWRDLLRVYRRLEARGEIRGGRFVAGFSGEQYALPEAVGLLREIRRRPGSGQFVSLSAADPLNLIGVLTPGGKLAALTGNRLLYRDGLPIAALSGGKVEFLTTVDEPTRWEAEKRLLRSSARGQLADLA